MNYYQLPCATLRFSFKDFIKGRHPKPSIADSASKYGFDTKVLSQQVFDHLELIIQTWLWNAGHRLGYGNILFDHKFNLSVKDEEVRGKIRRVLIETITKYEQRLKLKNVSVESGQISLIIKIEGSLIIPGLQGPDENFEFPFDLT